jgi:uncharacterized protein YjbI with pentapeptide repeats
MTAINNWKQTVRRLRSSRSRGVSWDNDGWNYLVFKRIIFRGLPPSMRFFDAFFNKCKIDIGDDTPNPVDFKCCRFNECKFTGDYTRTIFEDSRFRMCDFRGAIFTKLALEGTRNTLQYFKDRGAEIR